jgi:hypothetical protein
MKETTMARRPQDAARFRPPGLVAPVILTV